MVSPDQATRIQTRKRHRCDKQTTHTHISDRVTDVTFRIPRGQRGEQRRKTETSSPRLTHDLLLIVAMLCLL